MQQLCLLFLCFLVRGFSFSQPQFMGRSNRIKNDHQRIRFELYINFSWFGNKDDAQVQPRNDEGSTLTKDSRGNLGGVAGVIDSMERYKKSQRIGKMTASLVHDLSQRTVEGIGANGNIVVVFDSQQRAVSTFLELNYFESASALDVAAELTIAVKDAYKKSNESMDQVTQFFYSELGNGILDIHVQDPSEHEGTAKSTKGKTKVDRLKTSLSHELASSTVEGTAESGKVKAIYDGLQRPLSILIDENYFENAFLLEDVCDAVTASLQDAYAKSIERMDEKMKSIYAELGVATN